MSEELMYGAGDTERLLHTDPMDFVMEKIDDFCDHPGEPLDVIADRMEWPVRVYEYRRMVLPKELIARRALEQVLESLDEEYSDPDGDVTNPTEGMIRAAESFAEAVVREYVVFSCEQTGHIIEVTREQAIGECVRRSK